VYSVSGRLAGRLAIRVGAATRGQLMYMQTKDEITTDKTATTVV